jgi:PKD repeat protein
MRKFYLLTTLILFLFARAYSQDTANFSFTIGLNDQVSFINTSHLHGDAVRKAFWSFGDGTKQMTTALGNAFHQYSGAGTYTACLRIYKYSSSSNDSVITGEACKTFTLSNTTADSCRAGFTNSGSSATDLTQVFVAQPWHNHEKRPEEICWNFGDNHDTCIKYDPALSNNYAVYHHYAQRGQYQVCVKIRYQGGCQSDYCRTITVGGDECKVDYTVDAVTASPLSKHFVAQPVSALQKKPLKICWDFGDGSTECKQYTTSYNESYAISHTYAKGGTYNVCVSVLFDGGCESRKCKFVTVETPTTDCAVNVFEVATTATNLERHFYVGLMNDRQVEKICWIFGDGRDTCFSVSYPLTNAALLIGHHYPAPGVYHVCVRVKYAGGCEAEKCREVVIRSSANVCGGYMLDSVTGTRTIAFKGFSIQNSNDHVVSWRWTFGDGSSADGQQVSHTYASGGSYGVCLYIKTDLGCETRICKNVTVEGENHPRLVLTPNPVITTLHATFLSLLQEQVTINIYNANGILLKTYSKTAIVGTNTWEFGVGDLPAGIYSVIVSSQHQLANAIFFKQ